MPTPKWFNGLKEQGGHHPPVFLFFYQVKCYPAVQNKDWLGEKIVFE